MWRRYPGRLAHLEGDARPLFGPDGTRVGTVWTARCGRLLRFCWDSRSWSTEAVYGPELAAEEPRGWCLRCAYWGASDALLDVGTFADFTTRVYAGRYRLVG